jgi:hypothetical protein
MDRDSVRTVVKATIILMTRLARRTTTQADDLMASILGTNEDRLVDAVVHLLAQPTQPPTEEQVVDALKRVGIRV